MIEIERLTRGVRLRKSEINLDIEETLEGHMSFQIYGPEDKPMAMRISPKDEVYPMLADMYARVIRYNNVTGNKSNHVLLHDDESFVSQTGMKITKGLTGMKLELVGKPNGLVNSVTVSKDSTINSNVSHVSSRILKTQLENMKCLQIEESQEIKQLKLSIK